MRKRLEICGRICLGILFLFLSSAIMAQVYFFEGDEVVFEFDRRLYAKAAEENKLEELDFADLKINEVIVSGNFNDWSKEDWRMIKKGRHKFQLRKSIQDFNDVFTWEFKFLVNGQYWIEAKQGTDQKKVLSNDFWEETFNLTLNAIEPDENGNTLFQLKGYEWAEQVILAGNFNNWHERHLKMKKVDGGWELRLDLPPGRYEYKFIADGAWLHDPKNPNKVRNEHNTFNSVLFLEKKISFQLSGFPDAQEVILAGSFNDWKEHDIRMERENNKWSITLDLKEGKHLYKFIVDGQWMTDPANPLKERDRKGNVNSVLIIR